MAGIVKETRIKFSVTDPLGMKAGITRTGGCWWQLAQFENFSDKRWYWDFLTQPQAIFKKGIDDLFSLDREKVAIFVRDLNSNTWMAIQHGYFHGIRKSPEEVINAVRNVVCLVDRLKAEGYQEIDRSISERLSGLVEEALNPGRSDRQIPVTPPSAERESWVKSFLSGWPPELSFPLYRLLKDEPREAIIALSMTDKSGTFGALITSIPNKEELFELTKLLIYFQPARLESLSPLLEAQMQRLSIPATTLIPGTKAIIALKTPFVSIELLDIALGKREPDWEHLDSRDRAYILTALLTLFVREPQETLEIINKKIGVERFLSFFEANNIDGVTGPVSRFSELKGIPFELLPVEHLLPLTVGLLMLIEITKTKKGANTTGLDLILRKGQPPEDAAATMRSHLSNLIAFRLLIGGLLNNNAKAWWSIEEDCRIFYRSLTAKALCLLVEACLPEAYRITMAFPTGKEPNEIGRFAWSNFLRAVVEKGKLSDFQHLFEFHFAPFDYASTEEWEEAKHLKEKAFEDIITEFGPGVVDWAKTRTTTFPSKYVDELSHLLDAIELKHQQEDTY